MIRLVGEYEFSLYGKQSMQLHSLQLHMMDARYHTYQNLVLVRVCIKYPSVCKKSELTQRQADFNFSQTHTIQSLYTHSHSLESLLLLLLSKMMDGPGRLCSSVYFCVLMSPHYSLYVQSNSA
jgi:hypothetical protein